MNTINNVNTYLSRGLLFFFLSISLSLVKYINILFMKAIESNNKLAKQKEISLIWFVVAKYISFILVTGKYYHQQERKYSQEKKTNKKM